MKIVFIRQKTGMYGWLNSWPCSLQTGATQYASDVALPVARYLFVSPRSTVWEFHGHSNYTD
jgi:hypothetical protein